MALTAQDISAGYTTVGSLDNSHNTTVPAGLMPTRNIVDTVANPVTGTTNGIPYANRNPGRDTYRMYDPTGWVQNGNVTGKLGSYDGPVAHQYVPFGRGTELDPSEGFNQVMMELSQHFEPMIQAKVMKQPRWWHDRIPRGSFQLFNGLVHETRIFRGGLVKYAGLDEWQDIDPYPSSSNNPCGTLPFNTYKYGWEALSWRPKKSAWGSDPVCVDQFKFMDQAQQQLAWILQVGAEYGIAMQEVWNRDMFIYQSVAFKRSFVMSSEFDGSTTSPRYFYDPFKYRNATSEYLTLDSNGKATKPFVLIDASVKIESINFDTLDRVRESLKTRCPEAAVSHVGGSPAFAIAMSADDVERYIRGNEEERKLWVEANPQALITGYGFAPTTFRKWIITDDGNQLRFKIKALIPSYTVGVGSVAATFDNIGVGVLDNKPVYVAEFVEPMIQSPSRVGINNTVIPEDNPEYYTAELAIAPIFMNQVFTNQFIPSVNSLGSGTSFGPVTGLNGNWGWLNIQTPENPFRNRGNFYGMYEINPKPEACVVHCTSFIYKRCTAALPSLCPAQNPHVNRTAFASANVAVDSTVVNHEFGPTGSKVFKYATAELQLDNGILVGTGDRVTVSILDDSSESESYATGEFEAFVVKAGTPTKVTVQFAGTTAATVPTVVPAGSIVVNPSAPTVVDERA